jgi:hypothetical protein
VSNPGTSIAARATAVIGGAFATLAAVVIHQTAALPLGVALDLAPILGAETIIPWVVAIGLVILGWIPAFFPRTVGSSEWLSSSLAASP